MCDYHSLIKSDEQASDDKKSVGGLQENANQSHGQPPTIGDERDAMREQILLLQKQVQEEQQKVTNQANRMKYLQADLINLQKQTDRLISEAKLQAKYVWILEVISIKEDLERAVRALQDSTQKSLLEGLILVLSRIDNTLKLEGVRAIEVQEKTKFDPLLHEAVSYQETDESDAGRVLAVISQGYSVDGKVIKPALVEVARQKSVQDTGDRAKEVKTAEASSEHVKHQADPDKKKATSE